MKSNDSIRADEWRMAEKLARQADENARFAALPDDKRRVAIAQDVLKWLKTAKLLAEKQRYIDAPPEVENEGVINGYSCQACALGSLFAVAAERKLIDSRVSSYLAGYEIRADLSPYFDEVQLGLIEIAFEGPMNTNSETSDTGAPSDAHEAAGATSVRWGEVADDSKTDEIRAAEKFNKNVRNPRTRMERIMRNIIANRGEFKP